VNYNYSLHSLLALVTKNSKLFMSFKIINWFN